MRYNILYYKESGPIWDADSVPRDASSYLVPFKSYLRRCDVTVGVGEVGGDAVALGYLLHLSVDAQDGLSLTVSLRKGGLELVMG